MKDYEKILGELGYEYEGSFAGYELYTNWSKKIRIFFLPEKEEIYDIEYFSTEDEYFDNIDLWDILNTIATIENKLLKSGFVFYKDYVFALPNEREQRRELSDRNRKEREI